MEKISRPNTSKLMTPHIRKIEFLSDKKLKNQKIINFSFTSERERDDSRDIWGYSFKKIRIKYYERAPRFRRVTSLKDSGKVGTLLVYGCNLVEI